MKYYIDSQIILGRKIGLLFYLYIMNIVIFALSLIIFLTLFHYKIYYKVKGIVELLDDKYYIRIYVPLDSVDYIFNNNFVRINKKNYSYQVVSNGVEYITDNKFTYQVILIKVNLPSKYKYNNLCLDLQFLKENKRVIDYIIRR